MEINDRFIRSTSTWLDLNNEGRFVDARKYYYDEMFNDIIDRFVHLDESVKEHQNGVLFSMLGFTPEPIILTQRLLNPSIHVIFTSNEENEEMNEILGRFLTSRYKIIHLCDDGFCSIYEGLKEQMILYPSKEYSIDITGGKKSMVASAAIFGRDYNCNILYVDYDKYLPDLRRPEPGTERLTWVYRPTKDLPEIMTL